jgi:imidazolonepropionase-like amidohydrolase
MLAPPALLRAFRSVRSRALRRIATAGAACVLGAAAPAAASEAPPVVIRAGLLWDGIAETPVGPVEVLIENGRISAIGATVPRPAGASIVDLTGHTVTPGFIDTHVHVTLRPQFEDQIFNLSSAAKAILGVEALKILLGHGFTTVRDVGDMDIHGYATQDLARALEQGLIEGPEMIAAGHLISTRGGHGDASPLLGADSFPWQDSLADGVDEIRKVVRLEASRGSRGIKFAGTGGFSSPADNPSQTPYSQEEMNVLVGTARDLGLPASPHAYGDEGIRRAVTAGVRAIEHGSLASPATLAMMEQKGIYVVPTQIAVIRQARLIDDDSFWKAADKPPYVREKYRRYAAALMEAAHNLAGSNVKIAFGTDIGTFSFDQNNAAEFREMTTNGIATLRALRAGTSVAAEMLGLTDRGVLAPGKRADIVAMPGNPFADIAATESVDFVMQAGAVKRSPAVTPPR